MSGPIGRAADDHARDGDQQRLARPLGKTGLEAGLDAEMGGGAEATTTGGGPGPGAEAGSRPGAGEGTPDPAGGEAAAAEDRAAPPVLGPADRAAGRPPLPLGPGQNVGRYKLLQVIGEGGFGNVFMAEQERPIRRRVALKVIKLGMDTKQVIARFEAERQALAMMDHPNIAKVLDAGATEAGRPYFVMELVKGVPITDYCDREKLGTRERLRLFVPVCQAVQHAHQKGIIHRDLKPSNVLVTVQEDGTPVPKVIDFGIAKATQARLTEKTLFTELRQLIGTPEYMSPEQAEMSGLDVDTRTDIYSLGVLLYKLLTGTTPLQPQDLQSKGYAEIQRIIREVEPPRPSTRLATMGGELATVSSQRRTDPRALAKVMRDDLDWIVMKCLEKDRSRRYETANGLALDVQRYLRSEPVSASPPSAAYRLRKFARRHRPALGTGVALLVMLVIAGAAVVRYAFQQRRLARDRAALVVARDDFMREQERAISGLHNEQRKTNTDLYHALLRHAAAVRLARLPGYRATVWEDLHQANRLNTPARDLEDIKKEVLACLDDPIGLEAVEVPSATQPALPGARSGQAGRRYRVTHGKLRAAVEGAQIRLYGEGEAPLASVPIPLGNTVYDLEFSPDGRLLAVGCDQGVAVLVVPGLGQHTFYRGQWASSVAFDPGGNLLASTGDFITLWSMRSNRPVASLPQPGGDQDSVRVAFSADGQRLLAMRGDKTLSAWPVGSTPEKVQLAGHFGGVPTVVHSPDGRFIASVGKDLLVKVWDGRTGRLLHSGERHRVTIQTAAFHPDGTLLATGDDAGQVVLWDPRDGQPLGQLDASALRKPWRMHFDGSGRYLLVGGVRGLGAWAVRRSEQGAVSADRFFALTTPQRVADVAIHPDGTQFAFTQGGRIYTYDLTGSRTGVVAGPAPWGYFNSLHFDPAGGRLRYTAESGNLAVATWRAEAPAARVVDRPVKHMAQSRDGRWLATFTPDDGVIVYDAETSQRWCTLPAGGVEVWTLAWHPDGTRLAVGHADGTMSLWDLEQVRARLAEFGIALPSTAAREPSGPTPEPLSQSTFERIVKLHKGQPHPWAPVTRIETAEAYVGPDRFPAPAEEWSGWRGPRGDLISRETFLSTVWPAGGPAMLWRAAVGLGYASPVASGGRVYVFSLHQGQETLTAFDALSGRILWSEADGSGWTARYPGTRASPTVDGNAVYTYGAKGVLVRRDLATGRRMWRLDVLDQVGAANLKWGAASSPLVVGSRVYLQGGTGGPVAVAVEKGSGRIEWTSEARGEAGYAQPLLADVNGTPQLIVVGADAVYGINPGDGKTIWTEPWKTESEARSSPPTYAGGLLLVTDEAGALMLRLSPDGANRVWANNDVTPSYHGVILDDGLAFTNSNGTLKCMNWPDLTVKWSAEHPALGLGEGGSLVRVRGHLVAMSQGGRLSLIRADGEGVQLISQAQVFSPNDPQFVWPTPLVYGGRLYVKGEQELHCYDVSRPAATRPTGG